MGQWRLEMNLITGIGFYISFTKEEITVAIPFVSIYIGLTKHASGMNLFGWKEY